MLNNTPFEETITEIFLRRLIRTKKTNTPSLMRSSEHLRLEEEEWEEEEIERRHQGEENVDKNRPHQEEDRRVINSFKEGTWIKISTHF